MKKTLLSFIFIFFILNLFGQKNYLKEDSLLLFRGIYLQNLKTLIPWKTNYSEIKNYGNPIISEKPKHRSIIQIKWDSVRIINNFVVNLFIQAPKSFLSKKKEIRIAEFRALIDSGLAANISSYIVNLTGKNGNHIVNRKNTYTRWDMNNCRLTIGYDKRIGYFLIINK